VHCGPDSGVGPGRQGTRGRDGAPQYSIGRPSAAAGGAVCPVHRIHWQMHGCCSRRALQLVELFLS
jgi:hypothetical protein